MVVPFEADHSYCMYCSHVMIAQNMIIHCAMLAVCMMIVVSQGLDGATVATFDGPSRYYIHAIIADSFPSL